MGNGQAILFLPMAGGQALPAVGGGLIVEGRVPGAEDEAVPDEVASVGGMGLVAQVAGAPSSDLDHVEAMEIQRAVAEPGFLFSQEIFVQGVRVALRAKGVLLGRVDFVGAGGIAGFQEGGLGGAVGGVADRAGAFFHDPVDQGGLLEAFHDVLEHPPFVLNGHVVAGQAAFGGVLPNEFPLSPAMGVVAETAFGFQLEMLVPIGEVLHFFQEIFVAARALAEVLLGAEPVPDPAFVRVVAGGARAPERRVGQLGLGEFPPNVYVAGQADEVLPFLQNGRPERVWGHVASRALLFEKKGVDDSPSLALFGMARGVAAGFLWIFKAALGHNHRGEPAGGGRREFRRALDTGEKPQEAEGEAEDAAVTEPVF